MYGRSLLDSEFSTIKKHPAIGAKLASEHSSTRDYVDVIKGHHSKGKVFSDFEKEVIKGAGTHYAPFLVDLFKQPELREDIDYLLNEGRNKLYRETFRLLKRRER